MRKKWICRTDNDGVTHFIDISDDVGSSPSTSSFYVHEDTIPSTWHPADGRYYNSKSKFREVTRAHGCREIGNDWFHKDGSINRNAVATQPKAERPRDTLIKVLKGEYH